VTGKTITDEDKSRHDFKNQLAIVLGFSEILLTEAAEDDPRRADLKEIHKAAAAALDLLARLYPDPAEDAVAPAICDVGPVTDRQ
jgi:hypothetical protein